MRCNLRLGVFFAGFLSVTLPTVPASASSYRVLYSFTGTSDGYEPNASLINVGGTLYGTTFEDSPIHGHGTVFSVNPTTGTETMVYEFKGGSDGSNPYAGLIKVGGTLYGTTVQGGDPNSGTVFSLSLKTGTETVVCTFQDGSNGDYPYAGLIKVGGTLYGTTEQGGTARQGNVFSVNKRTGVETLVYSFNGGSDGARPLAGLIDVGGILYGTTVSGDAGYGTVFSVNPTTGTETVVHAFKGGSDGAYAYAGLINFGGTLYGTTAEGGTNGFGTVFSLNPKTGVLTVLYSFAGGSDGAYPVASLLNFGGMLYGTTVRGGLTTGDAGGGRGVQPTRHEGNGTVFSVNPTTGAETVVHAFKGEKNGKYPYASLINVGGTLYGTTAGGGTGQCKKGCGTVFAFTP